MCITHKHCAVKLLELVPSRAEHVEKVGRTSLRCNKQVRQY